MRFQPVLVGLAFAAVSTAIPLLQHRDPHHGRGAEGGTHTFSAITMKSTGGKCLAAQPGTGADANPVLLQGCDASQGQQWRIITEGFRDALIVNSLTNECLNFDGSKQAGQQMALVSCAEGVASKGKRQAGPPKGSSMKGLQLTIEPLGTQGQCVTVKDEKALESIACNDNDSAQLFTMA
jgi:hypothetical protein